MATSVRSLVGLPRSSSPVPRTPQESSDHIKGFYRRACAHADKTIQTLEPDAVGLVPWWGEADRETTLGVIMLLMVSETHRHGGHVDVVRELIDGSVAGRDTGSHEVTDEPLRQEYVARLEAAARAGAERWGHDGSSTCPSAR